MTYSLTIYLPDDLIEKALKKFGSAQKFNDIAKEKMKEEVTKLVEKSG